jgi:hypothetical protein
MDTTMPLQEDTTTPPPEGTAWMATGTGSSAEEDAAVSSEEDNTATPYETPPQGEPHEDGTTPMEMERDTAESTVEAPAAETSGEVLEEDEEEEETATPMDIDTAADADADAVDNELADSLFGSAMSTPAP